jgi:hypothetical protein
MATVNQIGFDLDNVNNDENAAHLAKTKKNFSNYFKFWK